MRHYGLFASISVTLVEDVLPADDALSVARRSCHALNMILGPNKGTPAATLRAWGRICADEITVGVESKNGRS